jgi:hypothetical protein
MYDQSAPPPPAKPKVSITLIVLVGVLIVLAVGWVFDRRARNAAQAAHDKLDALLRREDELDPSETINDAPLTPTEVQKVVGRAPDTPGDKVGGEWHTAYSWRGVFYRYTVYAKFHGAGTGPVDEGSDSVVLSEVTLNKPTE